MKCHIAPGTFAHRECPEERTAASHCGLIPSILFFVFVSLSATSVWAQKAQEVWFAPDGASPDLLDLFRKPDLWRQARAHVSVFKFGPLRLTANAKVKRNSFEELKDVDAFRKLHAWGIKIGSEEGAIKEWDCTGMRAAKVTEMHIQNVHAAGGTIDVIAMDEPLSSAREACRVPAAEAARRTAAYVRTIESSNEVKTIGLTPSIGDIEPYPSVSESDLEAWTDDLIASGYRPAFFHIDVNVHFVDVHREVHLEKDLRTLQAFFRQKGIPFGIILWSGYDPLNSDQVYYDHVMSLARLVKTAVGRPDQVIFQSWVKRSPKSCRESEKSCSLEPCGPADPPYCGENSIPLNLPESDSSVFSHTRLINDALSTLDPK